MASVGLFAVSIVYCRSEEVRWLLDEEGMIIGAAPSIGISCVVGYAMAGNKELAVAEVRGAYKNKYPDADGWAEQLVGTQHIPIEGLAQLTMAWVKWYWRRVRRLVGMS